MTPPKVLVADSISKSGIDELSRDGALDVTIKTGLNETELADQIPGFSALIVRSQTKVTAAILNAGAKLRVVGRAGVGVDNVDVETATRRGIVVLNAPGDQHFRSILDVIGRPDLKDDPRFATRTVLKAKDPAQSTSSVKGTTCPPPFSTASRTAVAMSTAPGVSE